MNDTLEVTTIHKEHSQAVDHTIKEVNDLLRNGKINEANEILTKTTKLLKDKPSDTKVLFEKLVSLNYIMGDTASLYNSLVTFGNKLAETGLFKASQDAFSTALSIDPTGKECYFFIAKSILLSGDMPFGISSLRKVIDNDPSNKDAFELLIQSCLNYRPEVALPYVQGYLLHFQDNPKAHHDVARIYELLGMQTEAVQTRIKMINLIKNEQEILTHLYESQRLYPEESTFHSQVFEIMLAKGEFEHVDLELSNLCRIAKHNNDTKSALIYSEMRLVIDPSSEILREEVKLMRKELGFMLSPLTVNAPPLRFLADAKRCLLQLDLVSYTSECERVLQQAINEGNFELIKSIRRELLTVDEFRSILDTRFEGPNATPANLWAKIHSAESSRENLEYLHMENPKSLPILIKLLEVLQNDVTEIVNTWIKLAEIALNASDFEALSFYMGILSQAFPSLAIFLPKIRPILLQTLRS